MTLKESDNLHDLGGSFYEDNVKPLLEFFYKELIKTYDLRISLLNFN